MSRDAIDTAYLSLVLGESNWRFRAVGAALGAIHSGFVFDSRVQVGGPW